MRIRAGMTRSWTGVCRGNRAGYAGAARERRAIAGGTRRSWPSWAGHWTRAQILADSKESLRVFGDPVAQ